MKHLTVLIIVVIIAATFLPSVLIPYPCYQAPCNEGRDCFRGVEHCAETGKHGHKPVQSAGVLHISPQTIQDAIAAVLHGD